MASVSNPSSAVDLSDGALLLGDPGDVTLLDGRSRPAAAVLALIADADRTAPLGVRLDDAATIGPVVDAGAALIHVPATMADVEEIRGAAVGGVAVVVSGDLEDAWSLARALLDAGAPPMRLVLEVPVGSGSPALSRSQIDDAGHLGLVMGAVLVPGPGPADEVLGWEIGMLTHLLELGVRTVRNVPMARFRRVVAVIDAIDGADATDGVGGGVRGR